MSEFEAIKKPIKQAPKKEGECPECGGDVVHGQIPCPEARPGCIVMHIGYKCLSCGAILKKSEDT